MTGRAAPGWLYSLSKYGIVEVLGYVQEVDNDGHQVADYVQPEDDLGDVVIIGRVVRRLVRQHWHRDRRTQAMLQRGASTQPGIGNGSALIECYMGDWCHMRLVLHEGWCYMGTGVT